MRRIFTTVVILSVVVVGAGGALSSTQERDAWACFGLPPTIAGTSDNDRLRGTSGPDVIRGGEGNDVIRGLGGDDAICGGAGHDLQIGGAGNDKLLGLVWNDDTLLGGAGDDTLRATRNVGFGGAGNDHLKKVNYAIPGPGDDLVNERFGVVSFEFAGGPVTVSVATGSATGEGTDTLPGRHLDVIGSEHDDRIDGDDGSNRLIGLGGNDTIAGFVGSDQIDGGLGDDDLDGGFGDHDDTDLVSVSDSPVGANVSLIGASSTGPGDDTVVGFESIGGSVFDDVLEGDAGSNGLFAWEGDDQVIGLAGDDYISYAESGDAGPGADECVSSTVANCEEQSRNPYDARSFARVVYPNYFDVIPAESFDAIEVDAVEGEESPVRRIRVALSRWGPNGCKSWSERQQRLVAHPCRNKYFRTIEPNGTLPPGDYTASAYAIRENGTRSETHRVSFTLE